MQMRIYFLLFRLCQMKKSSVVSLSYPRITERNKRIEHKKSYAINSPIAWYGLDFYAQNFA